MLYPKCYKNKQDYPLRVAINQWEYRGYRIIKSCKLFFINNNSVPVPFLNRNSLLSAKNHIDMLLGIEKQLKGE